MYRKIHITVNRASIRSKGETMYRCSEELKNEFNLGIFPEGGIQFTDFPQMSLFKEGAFRLAAETNTPIVPVVFLDNYYILPDDRIMEIKPRTCRIIYHKPIFPKGNSKEEIRQLKTEVFEIIQNELNKNYQCVEKGDQVKINPNEKK